MTTTVVKTLKYTLLSAVIAISLMACDKEIDAIGVNLVNNNNFSTNTLTTEVVATNKNNDSVLVNGTTQYLLGVYSDPEFGKLKASIITQLFLTDFGDQYAYGTNTAIDSVILSIPYQATKIENASDGKPQFTIDSVMGNADKPFLLKVYELKTFLNSLNPNDPTKVAQYYSNKVFQKASTPLYSGNFKVNPNDTVAYIKRYLNDGVTVFDIDTLKQDSKSPKIHIPLDETMIKQLLVDTAGTSEFDSQNDFIHAFRGLYIEADELADPASHIVSLNLSNSAMTIYYSDNEDEADGEDLNGNGVDGEAGVRVKHEYIFPFGNIKSNYFERDYTSSKQSGSNRIYVQGAAGSLATVDILGNEDLNALRQNNWLINDANLTFYVDQDASSDIAPEKLFLYNYDDGIQLKDLFTEGKPSLGGDLVLDDNGKPYKYVFRITDYMSDVFNENDPAPVYKLGLKVYNPTDDPANTLDTKVKNRNWNPKGVVLYGNDPSFQDKRVKLDISYSVLNN